MASKALLVFSLGLALSCQTSFCVTINGNAYENLVVALHGDLTNTINNETVSAQIVTEIENVITNFSTMLWETTDRLVYIKSVKVLLPSNWANLKPTTRTKTESYATADIRVERFMSNGEESMKPVAQNSKPCSFTGEYIRLSPNYFLDNNGAFTKAYGDRVKTLLHEWARFRYGVFEEYGYAYDTIFPYSYVNTRGFRQVTGCNNTEIEGKFETRDGTACSELDPEGYCLYKPKLEAAQGPTSSIMHMHFLNSVTKFCDSTTHDHFAPNKQNFYCYNRSVRSVMKYHPDLNRKNPVPSPARPTFTYVTPAKHAVYVILDSANHPQINQSVFESVRDSLRTTITSKMKADVYVGVASMGGSQNTTASAGRIGRYLVQRLSPVLFNDGTKGEVDTAFRAITRNDAGLLLDKALMDAGDLLRMFTHMAGSTVLIVKLGKAWEGGATQFNKPEISHFLMSRNIRLVTVELVTSPQQNNLEYLTLSTSGVYYKAATSAEVSAKINEAVTAIVNDIDKVYYSRTVPVVLEPVLITEGEIKRGFHPIDVRGTHGTELIFHLPSTVDCEFTVKTNNNATTYTQTSDIFDKSASWWNMGEHRIHKFKIPSDKEYYGFWHYEIHCPVISTSTKSVNGYVEVVYQLPDSKKPGIGGGGEPQTSLFQIETFTSEVNGIVNLDGNLFLIYAAVTKGSYIVKSANVWATVVDPDGVATRIALYDNETRSEYDLIPYDSVYSGYYKPVSKKDGIYHISFDIGGGRPTRSFWNDDDVVLDQRSLPINQDGYCCGSNGASDTVSVAGNPFRRSLPYAITTEVKSALALDNVPQRVTDLTAEVSADGTSVTLRWTAPKNETGASYKGKVSSYMIAYSPYPELLINERTATLNKQNATLLKPADILSGSVDPQEPGNPQQVTLRVDRMYSNSRVLYTVISSNNENRDSYPAPIAFVPGENPPPITTTTASPTTTTAVTSTTTIPTTTTTTQATSTTSRTTQTTTRSVVTTTVTPSSTTGKPDGAVTTSANSVLLCSLLFFVYAWLN